MKKTYICSLLLLTGVLSSCEDFLNREPISSVTPDQYFNTDSELAAYTINSYPFNFHSGWNSGIMNNDGNTDNMIVGDYSSTYYVKGYWKVPETGSSWNFSAIRSCNYFFEKVLPKYENGTITGSDTNIRHYIGEMYFLRAYNYFTMLKRFGDFPILTEVLIDDQVILNQHSNRRPRNEVARFILEDLDKAAEMMQNSGFKANNRLNRQTALLLKSRVALNEASFLTYHRGTPRVPGEEGWPGAKKDYNKDFTINLDSEIDFFLEQAMESSKEVADATPLTGNSHQTNPEVGQYSGWNNYFEMFGSQDLSKFPEVLLWKDYDLDLSVAHSVSVYILNGGNNGATRSFVDGFLMKNGLPIYAENSGYKGDKSIMEQKEDRDERLQLFIVGEKDRSRASNDTSYFGVPNIIGLTEVKDRTGFRIRKGYSYEPSQTSSSGLCSTTGCVIFRGVEAYLNYMEASYMKKGSIDGTAAEYWKQIRERAGIDTDFSITISATDLSKEADWAKYSGSELVDATLFNIRRERRNEFIGEAMRWDDLMRWRAMDMIDGYIPEGFNLWDEAYQSEAYMEKDKDDNLTGKSALYEEGNAPAGKEPNVSSRQSSKYLRPYQIIRANNECFNGYVWTKAYYLQPIPSLELKLTSADPGSGDVSTSPIYQNPGWSDQANMPAFD